MQVIGEAEQFLSVPSRQLLGLTGEMSEIWRLNRVRFLFGEVTDSEFAEPSKLCEFDFVDSTLAPLDVGKCFARYPEALGYLALFQPEVLAALT